MTPEFLLTTLIVVATPGAGVHDGRETGYRGDHVRNDAQRAGDRCDEAGLPATRHPRRHRVEHTGARRRHHDEGGEQELRRHGSSRSYA